MHGNSMQTRFRFDIKDLGKLHHFLGMKIVQDEASGSIWIGQPAYIEALLKRFLECNTRKPTLRPLILVTS